jgi:hypothetical protein
MAIKPVPFEIEKVYPPRGPLQQYRLAQSAAFSCFRCGQPKKSKLITVYRDDWSRRLCNGCYGRLLSIYEVKAGPAPDDERADALASVLMGLVSKDEIAGHQLRQLRPIGPGAADLLAVDRRGAGRSISQRQRASMTR